MPADAQGGPCGTVAVCGRETEGHRGEVEGRPIHARGDELGEDQECEL
jgi:hypothetical protein